MSARASLALALLAAACPSAALANPAHPVPIPEDPSLAPQLEIDAVGIGTLKLGNHEGKTRGEVDFSDSSIIVGAAQSVAGGGVGSLVLGGTIPNDTLRGQSSFFLHQALVDYQAERWEAVIGRTDQPTAHLIDFPTLRDDDLVGLTDALNPYSHAGVSEEQRYSNVAEVSLNQTQRTYESVYVEHLLGDPTSSAINAFGVTFEYAGLPGLEAFDRVPSWGATYRHVNNPGDGLHELALGAVLNLNESVTDRWTLQVQELLTLGPTVVAFADASDVASARSSAATASLTYRNSPFGKPGWQFSLTGGCRNFFDVPDAVLAGGALTALKRLGSGFDLAAQYIGQWRGAALAAVVSPGVRYEQSIELGFVYNFMATLNSHLTPRRRLLNIQHQFLSN